MNNNVNVFSSMNENELMNVDGGSVVALAVFIWSFNFTLAGICTYYR